MSLPPRDLHLLLSGGQVVACGREAPTPAQVDRAMAWCEDGGPWIPWGRDVAPPPQLVPWRCEHAFCPRPDRGAPCPWRVDGRSLVHCALRSFRDHPYPALFEGPAGDPPMVLKSCRVQATRPVRLASGLLLETPP